MLRKENLFKITPEEAKKINRNLYCHYCKHMGEMAPQGRDSQGLTVFKCGVEECGELVRMRVR